MSEKSSTFAAKYVYIYINRTRIRACYFERSRKGVHGEARIIGRFGGAKGVFDIVDYCDLLL